MKIFTFSVTSSASIELHDEHKIIDEQIQDEDLEDEEEAENVQDIPLDYIEEPVSYNDAFNRPDAKLWQNAMIDEYDSLLKNERWNLVDLPKDKKPISCKWVFKIKYRSNDEVERYKERLVARGFTQ